MALLNKLQIPSDCQYFVQESIYLYFLRCSTSNGDLNKTFLFQVRSGESRVPVARCNRSLTASLCLVRLEKSDRIAFVISPLRGKLVSRIVPMVLLVGYFPLSTEPTPWKVSFGEERRVGRRQASKCSHRSQSPKCLHHRDGIRLLSAASRRLEFVRQSFE